VSGIVPGVVGICIVFSSMKERGNVAVPGFYTMVIIEVYFVTPTLSNSFIPFSERQDN
jgi:hypothetical protein